MKLLKLFFQKLKFFYPSCLFIYILRTLLDRLTRSKMDENQKFQTGFSETGKMFWKFLNVVRIAIERALI